MKRIANPAWGLALAATLVSVSALAQHVTVTDPTRLTKSGFLSDYSRLQKTDWGGGIECWREGGLDAKKYDKVMISRIVLSLKPKEGEDVTIAPPTSRR